MPEFYSELLKMVAAKNKGEACELNPELLNDCDGDSVYVTAKDYKSKNGVVTQMNNVLNEGKGTDTLWFVKGPMGMGLSVDPNGHNIAFCGGTGILVFLDIVARMAIEMCGATTSQGVLGENFKFTLYFTAPSHE